MPGMEGSDDVGEVAKNVSLSQLVSTSETASLKSED